MSVWVERIWGDRGWAPKKSEGTGTTACSSPLTGPFECAHMWGIVAAWVPWCWVCLGLSRLCSVAHSVEWRPDTGQVFQASTVLLTLFLWILQKTKPTVLRYGCVSNASLHLGHQVGSYLSTVCMYRIICRMAVENDDQPLVCCALGRKGTDDSGTGGRILVSQWHQVNSSYCLLTLWEPVACDNGADVGDLAEITRSSTVHGDFSESICGDC